MRISIITPSYNQAAYLEKTIQSIISQGYDDLEYILIDGGSNDGSLEIIEKYKEHFAFWVSEKDEGQSHAINKGFKHATGDIITWINSDDQLMPNALHQIAAEFEKDTNKEIFVAHGKTILFGENMQDKEFGASKTNFLERSLAGLPFPQPSSFFRKELINNYGNLKQEFHFGMDYEFFVPVFLNEKSIYIDNIFSKYLYHNESKSLTQQSGFARDYAKVFSKILRSFEKSKNPNHQEVVKKTISKFRELNFYTESNDSDDIFEINNSFTEQQLHLAFCYNLLNQLIFYYEAIETTNKQEQAQSWKQVKKITSYLVKNEADFVAQNPEVKQVYQRSKFLNPMLMGFLRKVKKVL
ncbi:glycosyl transferase [Bernardetia litoralis DSM 6794]|uniref:Glycosyl transferase n=1 Tax=Bernardetia litoralis (strain ATCC 23117 / DSM 6794 / NBRC 15988 / NCIMB 1366 / Fx l1 / Sio-4) TaxID=880071 RepID=I4ANI7_BERLS|nr:glycosyltransferase family 2 protein [Bernardetia litoralis]AFM05522.1 glycosyl transferase [Bernardetia litoralis DSM 6794]